MKSELLNVLCRYLRPEFGARELRRQIRSLIETRLASAVLRGDIEEGDSLRFVYDVHFPLTPLLL
ncbi:hypothetical protein [Idiomarina abyssalis]|uniref:hypothetical protein n=1 Tax=Idiomarina abyssalis TaxID=86102 RepID=UPI000943800E